MSQELDGALMCPFISEKLLNANQNHNQRRQAGHAALIEEHPVLFWATSEREAASTPGPRPDVRFKRKSKLISVDVSGLPKLLPLDDLHLQTQGFRSRILLKDTQQFFIAEVSHRM